MKEIRVPQLGVNDEKITIVEWLVKSGESIEVNQEICTVETTKSNVSVESPYEGFIQILVDEGKYSEALKIISNYEEMLKLPAKDGESWECKECKKVNPDTFEICWSCQGNRMMDA